MPINKNMTRKLYVKQMKMSNLQEATNSSSQDVADQTEYKFLTKGKHPKQRAISSSNSIQTRDEFPCKTFSSTASMSSFSTVSLTTVRTSIGQEVSNKTPLPKVDVLIKGRTFQTAENHNSTLISKPSLTPPHIDTIGSEHSQLSNRSEDEWKKESEIALNSYLLPLPSHQSYDMDYSNTQSSGYDISENSVEVIKKESRDPSPVYHQMERPALPLADPGIYSNHLAMTSSDYSDLNTHVNEVSDAIPNNNNIIHEPSEIIGISEMEPYSHENSNPNHHDGDQNIQRYSHIRAWEQENSRYVDYTWRVEEQHQNQETVFMKTNSEVDDADDNIVFTRSQRSKRSSGRVGSAAKVSSNSGGSRRRRKRVQTPVQRSAANMRERRRMCHLNVAFDHLKDHLPHVKDKKKLSRIQTLKAAIYYIHLLQDSLNTAPRVSEL